MSDLGDILIENIKTEYYHLAFTPSQQGTEIVRAELGNDAYCGGCRLIKTYIIEKERI